MNNENEEILVLISRKLSGKISAEEEEQLEKWRNEDPANKTFYNETVGFRVPDPEFEPDVDLAWQKIKARTGIEKRSAGIFNVTGFYMKVAASLLLLVGAGWVFLSLYNQNNEQALHQYATGDHKEEFLLPDSSVVTLNKNSSLTYTESEGKRKINFKGEAFFDVKKDKDRPFVIEGLNSITTVVGTSFNLSIDSVNHEELVEVVSGKVSFESLLTGEKILVSPGFKASLDPVGEIARESSKNQNFLAWKTGNLKFNESKLSVIADMLSDYYGTKIELVNQQIKECRFTGTFKNNNLDEILEILSVATGVDYKKSGEVILLSGKGCN